MKFNQLINQIVKGVSGLCLRSFSNKIYKNLGYRANQYLKINLILKNAQENVFSYNFFSIYIYIIHNQKFYLESLQITEGAICSFVQQFSNLKNISIKSINNVYSFLIFRCV
ncbi:hypothetical protein ABPG72_013340 [Tetrahymena utriculariae]